MAFERNPVHEFETFVVIDDQDNEHEAVILAAFEETETKRTFVLYTLAEDGDIEDEEVEVYASILDTENETLVEIESDDDWALVEQVLQSLTVEEE